MKRLKEIRVERGLMQSELANYLGVGQNTVSNWEKGRYEPDIQSLIKLSKLLSVSIDYILDTSDEKENINKTDTNKYKLLEGLSEKEREKLFQYAEFLKYERALTNHGE